LRYLLTKWDGWDEQDFAKTTETVESTEHATAHSKRHSCTFYTSHMGPQDPVCLRKYFSTLFNGSEVQKPIQ